MDMTAILVMWPALCWWIFINFHLIKNFVENGLVVSDKNKFNFQMKTTLG